MLGGVERNCGDRLIDDLCIVDFHSTVQIQSGSD